MELKIHIGFELLYIVFNNFKNKNYDFINNTFDPQ